MKNITVGVCFLDMEGNIVTKRTIGVNWPVDMEKDLKRNFNINVMDEIAHILTENLKLELKQSVIKEMLNEVKDKENR
jgi:DNA-binding transcriptional regulator YhcF (GntR family)